MCMFRMCMFRICVCFGYMYVLDICMFWIYVCFGYMYVWYKEQNGTLHPSNEAIMKIEEDTYANLKLILVKMGDEFPYDEIWFGL